MDADTTYDGAEPFQSWLAATAADLTLAITSSSIVTGHDPRPASRCSHHDLLPVTLPRCRLTLLTILQFNDLSTITKPRY